MRGIPRRPGARPRTCKRGTVLRLVRAYVRACDGGTEVRREVQAWVLGQEPRAAGVSGPAARRTSSVQQAQIEIGECGNVACEHAGFVDPQGFRGRENIPKNLAALASCQKSSPGPLQSAPALPLPRAPPPPPPAAPVVKSQVPDETDEAVRGQVREHRDELGLCPGLAANARAARLPGTLGSPACQLVSLLKPAEPASAQGLTIWGGGR